MGGVLIFVLEKVGITFLTTRLTKTKMVTSKIIFLIAQEALGDQVSVNPPLLPSFWFYYPIINSTYNTIGLLLLFLFTVSSDL